MLYGTSYYPEHKDRAEFLQDLKLIKESGIDIVRMGEFAWCKLEPGEGDFHFEWMDYAIEEFGANGIRTILCTPTACPPVWMSEKYPGMLYTDNRGIKRPFGGRRHYCYNNPDFRKHSAIIAEEIGKRYGTNPYVAGFQIDNEPAQEGTGRCTCPVCREKFRQWLKKKYRTIDEFNKRSGSIFWSQEYTDFSQINPPVNSIETGAQQQINAFYENPTIRLEFERFSSDSQIEYQNIQYEVLRKFTGCPITTNATGLATNSIDYYTSSKTLSKYAFDYYPGLRNAKVDSFPYSFARGVKEGEPFWILEFMSGGGHRLSGSGRLQPNPGALKQAVVQGFAHGAQLLLHFQFRSFPIGAEQLNYAIVDMDGIPRRRYYEMKDTAEILKKLKPYEKAEFINQAALCFDYDSHWALRIKPVNDPDFNYPDYCGAFYNALMNRGVNTDVISLDQDFTKYRLLIFPAVFLLDLKYRKKLKEYVKQGGILIATFLTGVKNEDNIGYKESLPAGLTDLFGIRVEEVEPVFPQNRQKVCLHINGSELISEDGYWSELLDGQAEIIARYTEDYKKDKGVISRNKYGKGFAYYLGTNPDEGAMAFFLESICKEHNIKQNKIRYFAEPDKVEVVRRIYEERDIYFIFNFTGKDIQLPIPGVMKDCLNDASIQDSCSVEKNGFRILLDS